MSTNQLAGHSLFEALYQEKLDRLPLPFESFRMETSFGATHVLLAGPAAATPLILLHGANSCAADVLLLFKGLARHFRVAAADIVGEPNLSAPAKPNRLDLSYGHWLYELMMRMHMQEAIFAGVGLGAFAALKLAQLAPAAAMKLYCVHPSGLVNGRRHQLYTSLLLPLALQRLSGRPLLLKRMARSLYTAPTAADLQWWAMLQRHRPVDTAPLPLFEAGDFELVQNPVYCFGSRGDIISPGPPLLKRANAIFPSLAGTLLSEQEKHYPSPQLAQQLAQFIWETR